MDVSCARLSSSCSAACCSAWRCSLRRLSCRQQQGATRAPALSVAAAEPIAAVCFDPHIKDVHRATDCRSCSLFSRQRLANTVLCFALVTPCTSPKFITKHRNSNLKRHFLARCTPSCNTKFCGSPTSPLSIAAELLGCALRDPHPTTLHPNPTQPHLVQSEGPQLVQRWTKMRRATSAGCPVHGLPCQW